LKYTGTEIMQMDNQFAYIVRKVLTAVVMKSPPFWGIIPCSPFKVNRCLGGIFRQFFQGRKESQTRNKYEVDSKQSLLHAGFLLGLLFDPEDGGFMLLSNVSLIYKGLRGVIFPIILNTSNRLYNLLYSLKFL
jgi:hypothetical protein